MIVAEPGVVTQASPLLVQLDSSDTAAPALCLGSYTPVLADRVSTITQGAPPPQGTMILVLGVWA